MSALDVVAACFLVAGSLLALLGAVGVHRFGSSYARMHAATKPVTLAMVLVVLGAVLQVSEAAAVTKLVLAGVLQLVTVPLGMQLLGRSAYRSGEAQRAQLATDELVEEPAPEH